MCGHAEQGSYPLVGIAHLTEDVPERERVPPCGVPRRIRLRPPMLENPDAGLQHLHWDREQRLAAMHETLFQVGRQLPGQARRVDRGNEWIADPSAFGAAEHVAEGSDEKDENLCRKSSCRGISEARQGGRDAG